MERMQAVLLDHAAAQQQALAPVQGVLVGDSTLPILSSSLFVCHLPGPVERPAQHSKPPILPSSPAFPLACSRTSQHHCAG